MTNCRATVSSSSFRSLISPFQTHWSHSDHWNLFFPCSSHAGLTESRGWFVASGTTRTRWAASRRPSRSRPRCCWTRSRPPPPAPGSATDSSAAVFRMLVFVRCVVRCVVRCAAHWRCVAGRGVRWWRWRAHRCRLGCALVSVGSVTCWYGVVLCWCRFSGGGSGDSSDGGGRLTGVP